MTCMIYKNRFFKSAFGDRNTSDLFGEPQAGITRFILPISKPNIKKRCIRKRCMSFQLVKYLLNTTMTLHEFNGFPIAKPARNLSSNKKI